MKLYRVSNQSRHMPQEWVGTQDEAKKRSKEIGGFFDPVEVPTDKQGLLDWLNSNTVIEGKAGNEDVQPDAEPDVLRAAEQRAIAARTEEQQRRDELVNHQWTVTEIESFILDHASVSEVGNLFSCLGSRFKELAREVAGATKA